MTMQVSRLDIFYLMLEAVALASIMYFWGSSLKRISSKGLLPM